MEPRLIVSGDARIWREPNKLFTFERVGNLRPILEALKFLSSEEFIGIARAKKQFYEASFHSEVQKFRLKETNF